MDASRCSDYREWCGDTGAESDVYECLVGLGAMAFRRLEFF